MVKILAMLLAAPVPVIMSAYTDDVVTLRQLVLGSCLLFVAAILMLITDDPPPPSGGGFVY